MAVVGLVRPPRRSFFISSHETSVFLFLLQSTWTCVWFGLEFLTLSMVVSGTCPVGAHQDVRVGIVFSDFRSAKLTDFNRSRDSGFSFSQYLYTIMLSNIRVEKYCTIRRAKFQAIHKMQGDGPRRSRSRIRAGSACRGAATQRNRKKGDVV